MSIIEIIGASTIGIIIAAEFLAAIGIAITLYKIYGVTRRFETPQVHHHHHYQNDLGLGDIDTHDELVEDGYDHDEDEDAEEVPNEERPF
tara:strand:+ start:4053 stop:4322 length:270 start_codon:yes stop_codon:yes gene_type:complete